MAGETPYQHATLDTSSHQEFVDYYAKESLSQATQQRFESIRQKVLLLYRQKNSASGVIDVLDIGCGAGTQSVLWALGGDRVHGIDINAPLVALAKERAEAGHLNIDYKIGSATELPYRTASMDVCLIPELLEHVADWKPCLDEAVRVLRPGGVLFLSTTNFLCPRQNEFRLPLYSWYPGFVKRHIEKRAVTTWPAVANYARYPAVHWFSYYSLSHYLQRRGMRCFDRFDMIDVDVPQSTRKLLIQFIRAVPGLRLLGQICTEGSIVFAVKS